MEKIEYDLDPLSLEQSAEDNDEPEIMVGLVDSDPGVVYKVVIPEDSDQLISSGTLNSSNSVNSPCQFFVISNQASNEYLSTGHRNITPKISNNARTTTVPTNNVKKRDEHRRATHNEVERRRRDKINNWIMKLSTIIPDTSATDITRPQAAGGGGHFEGLSKGGILAKACEYINELKETNNSLTECLKDNEKIALENMRLRDTNEKISLENMRLRRENELLKAQLSSAPNTTRDS